MKEKIMGLSSKEVQERIDKKLVNYDTSVPTKSIKRILCENFFTLFNFLNLFLALSIFMVGSYKNMLFLLIVVINTAISTIQEIHSKRVVDKLSILSASKVCVIRDGKKQKLPIDQLVLDDIIEFHTGDQIPTDCTVLEGDFLVNESFITGEPDSITKKTGDTILSGSFVVSGKCIAKVIHIGEENYTAKISKEAHYIKKVKSEIMISLQKIIKVLTFIIIPMGLLQFVNQFYLQQISFQEAVVQTVASMIGMIPEGLVLLTSTVLALSVIRLSKSKVLVQDLYCIETLARVDTLCLDKTGTLTEGSLEVFDLIPFSNKSENLENILANLGKYSEDENATILAIRNHFSHIQEEFVPTKKVAFSSEKKWSGISFQGKGSYLLGAPEFLLLEDEKTKKEIEKYTEDYRVLLLAYTDEPLEKEHLPTTLKPLGIILLLDKIRSNASATLNYFYKQDVDIKIISGDNPKTVSKIAKRVGVKNYDRYLDMSTIKNDDVIEELVLKYTIFGRVSPSQKKEIILALKKLGRTVAMTGDGVNDVLALKEADCSIAMANGSDASKNVSQLVLLNSDFASMPKVVLEGRKSINNIQRSASLFLVKTIYSTLLSLMTLLFQVEYPFIPIQLTLISVVTIGIPSFLLALEPNHERVKGIFLKNILSNAFPTAILIVLSIGAILLLGKSQGIAEEKISSYCVLSTGIIGLGLLFTMVRSRKSEDAKLPFSIYRLILSIAMTGLFAFIITYFSSFFSLTF